MRRLWHDIATHRVAAVLFLVCWMVVYALHLLRWRRTYLPPGRDDMAPEVVVLNLLLPIVAGALVAWWRSWQPENRFGRRFSGGMFAGALVLLLDVTIVATPSAIQDPHGEGSPYIAVPMGILVSSCMGAVLGLLGALAGAGLSAAWDCLKHHGARSGRHATG